MTASLRRIAFALVAGLPVAALAQVTVVPASPVAFEPVVLRLTTDLCSVSQDVLTVTQEAGRIRVNTAAVGCIEPGVKKVLEIRLGSLPAGAYVVESNHVVEGNGFMIFQPIALTVRTVAATTVPPPKRPLTDYGGAWWTPSEGGWGLAIQQNPGDTLFAQLFVYGASGQPSWYTFQGGTWKSATRWEGTVYATNGPSFTSPVFDPARVGVQAVGPVSIEFEQVPGSEGIASLAYTVNGTPIAKRIQRLPF